ncbi:helix-turn-helix domain-containing protein [Chitinophaga sp. SYP-B3965]|uniref:helix-turn-helix domain-containing protein n=1 Tax=Chitinophaga sp. SYP-B3965 TaxID=2663120 RepID=UPI001299AF9D|nr:helix-turn-helix transcriptional regulator [Chitinophaga sp. SYP-B3965]MRG45593.1 helix-turn-helix domain-containing protein [Chitinophaga sp. SYP-B3965]
MPPAPDILILFGTNLRRIRKDKGFSQRELSSRCNIDNADISRMENGTINITLQTLQQLAEAMDIAVWELLVPRI